MPIFLVKKKKRQRNDKACIMQEEYIHIMGFVVVVVFMDFFVVLGFSGFGVIVCLGLFAGFYFLNFFIVFRNQ